MDTGMQGNSPGFKEHVRGYGLADNVLKSPKYDVSQALPHQIVSYYWCVGKHEEEVALEGLING